MLAIFIQNYDEPLTSSDSP